ncbi:ATP-binding protein [Rubrivivax benzoatilyticus]|uniref:AAA family ATPase n=1 Tax=Rubrivivax benzoatilyticus TaxID=316997 RepID=A0ABX0HY07_9BURK|nr:AAA family ATPase [Rubrivivax benzoatilyticus]EGJ10321.1 transcriptional activator domain-containing protein [Rubrivivax benzoatilyticus JA2 = ATCC BAA-35]NHK98486.1 AAA family ATPase [Rubrivivax benzoatilyticus]NHL23739.1 AAA family ATPase [Rubrivivax benzoatilyticus]
MTTPDGPAATPPPPSPAPVLRLELLRRHRLHAGAVAHELSRKDAALLAILALDGSASREQLARWLWPGADPARALASLRQRRFRLARCAGQPVIDGDERLRPAAALRHPALDPDGALAADASALDGDWLEGLAFDDCPEVERWLTQARERWRLLRAQALARVASTLEAEQRLAAALLLAQRLAEYEPLSDHAARRLMRLHHLRGDLGAAIEVYRRFAERLDAELGELPDDETAALAASLRQGEAPRRAPRPLPPVLRRPPRLVGRESAWQLLDAAWRDAATLLVEGAAGLGKTRLLADFLQPHDGVLRLAARPGDAERPYALLARLLARLWFDSDAPWPDGPQALPGWARRELSALLPELGAEAPPRLDALRLQRALAQALRPPPGRTPLRLLAFDDVHQADAATLELLPALAGDGLPCWLAVRSGEQPPALVRWMAASDPPRHLPLQPLDAAQLQQLLADVADGTAADADALLRYTGGIPLFVLETLRALHEQPGTAFDPGSAPAGAAAVVQARLQALPEAARQLAGVAAVLERPLTLGDAAAMLGGMPLDWSPAVRTLQASQWLDAQGQLHDLVRAAVRDALPAPLRAWLHGRAAAWLAQQPVPARRLAHHWQQAGRPELAAAQWRAAALEARRRARPLEETTLWDHAIAAWEACGRADAALADRLDSVEARLFTTGPEAVSRQTAALLEKAQDEGQRLAVLVVHLGVLQVAGDYEAALPLAEQALALARRRGDAAAELRAAQHLATTQVQFGRMAQALHGLEQAAPLLAAAPAQRFAYLSTRSWVLHRAGRLAECTRVLARCIVLARRAGDLMEACTCSSNMASLLVSLGRYGDALAAAEAALDLRAQLGPADGVHGANVDLNHGYVLLGLGRIAEALAAIARARDAFERCGGASLWPVIAANAMAGGELMRGDADAAAACLVAPTAQTPPFIAARHHVLAARIARARSQDPAPALAAGEAVLGATGDPVQSLALQAERLLAGPAPLAAAGLAGLQAQAHAVEQHANAARYGWLRIGCLLDTGDAGDAETAAAEARTLLARTAPRPIDLAPRTMWTLAARALVASPRVAARARREAARAALLER